MTRKNRILAAVAAGTGWAGAVVITFSTPHVDLIQEHPFVATRLVLVLGMAAGALSLGLWLDYKLPSPVTVEEVLQIGIRTGERMQMLRSRGLPEPDLERSWNEPSRDTPSAGWRRW